MERKSEAWTHLQGGEEAAGESTSIYMTFGGQGPAYSQHPYRHPLPETIPQQVLIWGFFSGLHPIHFTV